LVPFDGWCKLWPQLHSVGEHSGGPHTDACRKNLSALQAALWLFILHRSNCVRDWLYRPPWCEGIIILYGSFPYLFNAVKNGWYTTDVCVSHEQDPCAVEGKSGLCTFEFLDVAASLFPILLNLMMEAIRSSETSVLTKVT
jgi:hypothetical protein